MIGLTKEQKQRLINASSDLTMDARSKLSLAESEAYVKRIDEVLYELHMENPLAFVTNASRTLSGVEFIPLQSMIRHRKFYNQPVKVDSRDYFSHVIDLPKSRYL